jgi:DNA modification methylase
LTGEVIDGHLRLKGAVAEKLTELPVILCDHWTAAQVKAFRLTANRSVTWAAWDLDALALEFADLKSLEFSDLSLTGFDAQEIEQFTLDPNGTEDEVPALPDNPVSKRGDLWVLGDHRVLCGDATVEADVAKLMAGEAVDLVFTDPPYNVDYEGYTEEKLTIKGDKMTPEQFQQFLLDTFSSYRRIVKPGASMYVCHSSSWQREFQNSMEAAGFEARCQIIWAKNTFAWGFGRYKFQHEPIFYAHVAGEKDPWYGDKSQSTLWQEKKPAANRIHPTAKPVELVERALVNSSKAGDIVADLFGGSGSTLIGCERRGRKARLMEIDPKYADCIVRRWEEYSGNKATLDGSATVMAG